MRTKEKIDLLVHFYLSKKKEEWNSILKYRLSGLLERDRNQCILLYKEIVVLYEKKGNIGITIEDLCKRKYNGKLLKKETILKYLSGLVIAMKKLMASDYLFDNGDLLNYSYLNQIKNKEAFELYFSELSRIDGDDKNVSKHFSYTGYLMNRDLYFHPRYEIHTDKAITLFKHVIQVFKINSYIETLKLHLQIIQLKTIKGIDIKGWDDIESILNDSKGAQYFNDLRLRFYCEITTILIHPKQDVENILQLSESFQQNISNIPDYDAAYIYNLLSNTLIKLLRTGNESCLESIAVLNDASIETKAMLIDGKISYPHFLNMIFIKCDMVLKEGGLSPDSLISFIEKHIGKVSPNVQNYGKLITKKYVYLKFGLHQDSLNIGMPIFPTLADEILYKCLDIACLFYVDKSEKQFDASCLNYTRFLKSSKTTLNEFQIAGYLRFVSYLKKMYRLNKKINSSEIYDRFEFIPHIKKLDKELSDYTVFIPLRSWLLNTIKDIYKKSDT